MVDINKLIEDKTKEHGQFASNARLTQQMEDVLITSPNYNSWTFVQKEGAHMILHKLARLASGDMFNEDAALDLVGYATLFYKSIAKDTNPPFEKIYNSLK